MRSVVAAEPQRIDARDDRDTPRTGVADVEAAIAASLRAAGDPSRLEAVGVAAPGPLDHRRGVIHEAPNLPGFREVPLADDLRRLLGRPVFLDRDTVVAAIGEAAHGAARGVRDFVYVTISTGIGGAIVVDGRIVRGASGTAGEIGHWTVDPHGPRCGCGDSGHVEALASGSAIARAYGVDSAGEVFARARSGEVRASEIVDRAGRALADLAVGLVNVLNPSRIVVGGGVALGEPAFVFDTMRSAVASRAFDIAARDVRIVPAALGDDVGLVGALVMARERAAGREPLA